MNDGFSQLGTLSETTAEDHDDIDDIGDNLKDDVKTKLKLLKKKLLESINIKGDIEFSYIESAPSSPGGNNMLSPKHNKTKSVGFADNKEYRKLENAIDRLDKCEEILSLMEINLFNCENADDITKYDNIFRAHKVRISNFHRIFSNA